MRHIFFIYFLLGTLLLTAQQNCPLYKKYMSKGHLEMDKGSEANFETAINAYSIAMIHCPEKAKEAREEILKVFKAIEKVKKEAEKAKIIAEQKRKEAVEARLIADENAKRANQSAEKEKLYYKSALKSASESLEKQNKLDSLNFTSISKEIAIKSINLPLNQSQLKLILSKVAYDIYSNRNPAFKDNYIFNSLLDAFQTTTGSESNIIKNSYDSINDFCYDPNSNILYTAGAGYYSNYKKLFDADSILIFTHPNEKVYSYTTLDISTSNEWIAYGSRNGTVEVYNLESGQKIKQENIFKNKDITFEVCQLKSISDSVFASLETNGKTSKICHYLVNKDVVTQLKKCIRLPFRSRLFHPYRPDLIILQKGREIGMFNIENESFNLLFNYADSTAIPSAILFDSLSNRLFIGYTNGDIGVYKFNINKFNIIVPNPHNAIISSFSLNDSTLAVGCLDGSISIWDLTNIEQVQYFPIVLKAHNSLTNNLQFVGKSERLISTDSYGTIKFWNLDQEQLAQYNCNLINRELDDAEWHRYIGEQIKKYDICE